MDKEATLLYRALTSSIKIVSTEDTLKAVSNFDKRFAYVRFGDGEAMLMKGWEGHDGNHLNSDGLREELLEAYHITDKDYMIAPCYPYSTKQGREMFTYHDWLHLEGMLDESKRDLYYDQMVFPLLQLTRPDLMKEYFDKLNSKKIMFIGGKHLKNDMLKQEHYIEIPSTQAYYKIDEFYPKIIEKIKTTDIIILCAGTCTSILQKRIWKEGHDVITIGFGSYMDYLLGIQSRGWIKKYI